MSERESVQETQLHRECDSDIKDATKAEHKEDQPTLGDLIEKYTITEQFEELHNRRLDKGTIDVFNRIGRKCWSRTHISIVYRIFDVLFNSDIGHEFVEKHRRKSVFEKLSPEDQKAADDLVLASTEMCQRINTKSNDKPVHEQINDGLSKNDRIVNDLHGLLEMCEKNQDEVLANRKVINKHEAQFSGVNQTLDSLLNRIDALESINFSVGNIGDRLGVFAGEAEGLGQRMSRVEEDISENHEFIKKQEARVNSLFEISRSGVAISDEITERIRSIERDLDRRVDVNSQRLDAIEGMNTARGMETTLTRIARLEESVRSIRDNVQFKVTELSTRIRVLANDTSNHFNARRGPTDAGFENVKVLIHDMKQDKIQKLIASIYVELKTIKEEIGTA